MAPIILLLLVIILILYSKNKRQSELLNDKDIDNSSEIKSTPIEKPTKPKRRQPPSGIVYSDPEPQIKSQYKKVWKPKILKSSYKEKNGEVLLNFDIAGTHYCDIEDIEDTLEKNQILVLKREPNNEHDRNAVSIYTEEGRKLGYVPKSENQYLIKLTQKYKNLCARLSDNYRGLNVSIYKTGNLYTASPKKKKDMGWVKVTDEFKSVISKINNSNDNFLITGKAGTGKSTLLEYLQQNTKKKCVLLAPTGRASIIIGGQTLHSFFGLDLGILNPSDYSEKYNNKVKNLDIIIIDEVSMVRADILDSIDQILKFTLKNDLPFGGKQVVFFGDPFQLPPVMQNDAAAVKYFTENYSSGYYFDSKVFPLSQIRTIELKEVFRQQDESFIELLNRIRIGEYTANDLSRINDLVNDDIIDDDKIIITPFRAVAEETNKVNLDTIGYPEKEFPAKTTGTINMDRIPAPNPLVIKKGAKVMFVKNNKPLWVNGSLGIVSNIDDNSVAVIKEGGDNKVEKATWEEFKYRYNSATKELIKEVVGTFTQIPLILAWAITINKSQGGTFPKIHIDLGRGAFTYGQVYVALSRTKLMTDITLEKPILSSDIKVDQRVKDYYENIVFDESESEDKGGEPSSGSLESDEFVIGKEIWWPIIKGGSVSSLVEATIVNIYVDSSGIERAEIEFKTGTGMIVTLEELKKYKTKESSSDTFGW